VTNSPPASDIPTGGARATLWCLGVLGTLLLLGVVRILVHNTLTQDDAFFLDAAYQLADTHRLALEIWGNTLGHETLLASYPPIAPAIGMLDVWLMRLAHSVLFVKSSVVILQLVSAALLWQALGFVQSRRWRAMLVLATFVEPVSMTFYFTLRPEAVLMPLMLVLFMSVGRIIDGDTRPRAVLLSATLLGIFTHWQFPSTVGFIALTLGVVSLRERSGRAFATVYASATAAAYVGYGVWIAASPQRALAFQQQVLAAGTFSGWATKLKFLAGNILAGNFAAGSGFSVLIVVALILAVVRAVRLDGAGGPNDRGRALFDLGFLVAALVPALALDYVGPRAIPLYLVAIVIVLESACGSRRLRATWIAGAAVVAAAVNVAGTALLQHLYVHHPWMEGLIGMPLAWLATSIAATGLVRAGKDLRWAGGAALAGVGLVSVTGYVSVLTEPSLAVRDSVVGAILQQIPQSALRGAAVLCDVRDFYLPLRQSGAPAHIYATFPLLHFDSPGSFDQFVTDMQPTLILSTDALEQELKADTSSATRFRSWRASAFVLAKTFAIDGHRMTMYVRRASPIARPAS
jgi:hypothetical protein